MLVKGDKIVLKEKMGMFDNIGEVCEVVNVSDDGVISFRFGGVHMGCMSIDEFEKYFEKYEEPKYEEACDCCDECCDECDECCECDEDDSIINIMDNSEYTIFKVFDKCVVVACKLPNGFIVVESSACVDPDDYDENLAIENCINRIKSKIMTMESYKRCDEMCEDEDGNYDEEDYCDDCIGNCSSCPDSCPYCTDDE